MKHLNIDNYKEIRKEGCGRSAIVKFLVGVETLRFRFFIIRPFWKFKIKRKIKKWATEYAAYGRIMNQGDKNANETGTNID